jgi:hypothetical protein
MDLYATPGSLDVATLPTVRVGQRAFLTVGPNGQFRDGGLDPVGELDGVDVGRQHALSRQLQSSLDDALPDRPLYIPVLRVDMLGDRTGQHGVTARPAHGNPMLA